MEQPIVQLEDNLQYYCKGWVLKKGTFQIYSGLYLWKEQEFKIEESMNFPKNEK